MSIQTATDFVQRANEDEAIRKVARQRFADIVDVGREHGYDFTHDEFRQAMQERKASGVIQAQSVCQCGGDKAGDAVCQCGPEQCTSGGETTEETVCQCGPEQCTSGGETTEDVVCQCGPEQCTSGGETTEEAVCQCGGGPTGG